jgi:hypothetical protein
MHIIDKCTHVLLANTTHKTVTHHISVTTISRSLRLRLFVVFSQYKRCNCVQMLQCFRCKTAMQHELTVLEGYVVYYTHKRGLQMKHYMLCEKSMIVKSSYVLLYHSHVRSYVACTTAAAAKHYSLTNTLLNCLRLLLTPLAHTVNSDE